MTNAAVVTELVAVLGRVLMQRYDAKTVQSWLAGQGR